MNEVFGVLVANLTVALVALVLLTIPARVLQHHAQGWALVMGRVIVIVTVLQLFISVRMRVLAIDWIDHLVMFLPPVFSLVAGVVLSRRLSKG